MLACGSGDDSSVTAGSDAGITDGALVSDGSVAGLFDSCGGKIFDATGAVSADEYRKQAHAWDRATLDCRLGPKYDFYHPGDADSARPTAPELPSVPNPKGNLCPAFDHDTPGPATFGSTSGQVGYAPNDPADPGLDRLQTVGWEGGGQCYQPHQGSQLGGSHPDPAITQWQPQFPTPAVAIAKARTEVAETGDGVVIFSNGLVGTTGTQTSGSTHPFFMLPPNKVPTAVAVTNFNELALVTVWDTDALAGQVAVFALRAPKPESFSVNAFAAPNEGGFSAIQLLGYVDLPDMKTPTAISATGNNTGHQGPWIQSGDHAYQGIGKIFEDLSYPSMVANSGASVWTSDPLTGPGFFGSAGVAVIASRWEGKVAFLDLSPLYQLVRKVYVEPIQNKDNQALYTQATAPGPWPFDFTRNPEMKPTVVMTESVDHPTVVRVGVAPAKNASGLKTKLLAWTGTLGGHVIAYDVSSLTGAAATKGTPITSVADVTVDPNLTSMHLTNQNDTLFVSSRGNRSVQWLSVNGPGVTLDRTFRDSRVNDVVATDNNQRVGTLITVGDFSGGSVMSFERHDGPCTSEAGTDAATCTTYAFDGAETFPGAVYFVDTANVN